MAAIQQTGSQQLERVSGAARLVFARRPAAAAPRIGIADLYQRAPCRVLFPDVEPDDAFTAALLTTSGGLTGGDRLDIDVEVQAGAAVTVTTQAAEKIYRSNGDTCTIDVRLNVGADAWAEWLMQETILFDRAVLSRRIAADVSPTGRLLAVESLVFGRAAMGEELRRGFIRDQWRIRCGGRLIWADALKLEGDIAAEMAKPFGLGDAAACATLVYCGADAGQWLEPARGILGNSGAKGAVTSFGGLLIARLWAEDASRLRVGVAHCVSRLRHAIAGLPARMPRLWSI